MDKKNVEHFKQWFADYTRTFDSTNSDLQQNIDLKREHTKRVCAEALTLGRALDLCAADLHLVEIIALFHDVGRFEQYAQYQTFRDQDSINHAELGVKILQDNQVLKQMDDTVQDLIFRVIGYHNRQSLPEGEDERCLLFTKLLRDADKLDIWRVVNGYYHNTGGKRNPAIGLGLPDTPEISPSVCEDLMAEHVVCIDHVHNLNDLKLLQAAWIYDLNYAPTLQTVKERDYLGQIRDALPKSEQVALIFAKIDTYLDSRISA